MIDVTVKVPVERVSEFYSMYGAWLSAPSAAEAVDNVSGEVHEPWRTTDLELAAVVWSKLSETAQALFSTLIDAPGRKFGGDELAEMLNLSYGKHGIAGVLAWPGRHCFAVGRVAPWSWEYPEEGGPAVYWFTAEIAGLFGQARER